MQSITRLLTVDTPKAIRRAMREATAGTYIEIAPGLYPFNSALTVRNGGSTDAPIVVRAKPPGSVGLTFEHVDGIMVNLPYWAFENLNIRGICANHYTYQHAFHVTGQGSHADNTLLNTAGSRSDHSPQMLYLQVICTTAYTDSR